MTSDYSTLMVRVLGAIAVCRGELAALHALREGHMRKTFERECLDGRMAHKQATLDRLLAAYASEETGSMRAKRREMPPTLRVSQWVGRAEARALVHPELVGSGL